MNQTIQKLTKFLITPLVSLFFATSAFAHADHDDVIVHTTQVGQSVSQRAGQTELREQVEAQLRALLQQVIRELLAEVARLSREQANDRDTEDNGADTIEVDEEEEEELVDMEAQKVELLAEGDEVTFSVRSDGSVRFSNSDDPLFSRTWDFVSSVVPLEYRTKFDQVTFQNDPNTRFAAHVYQRISTRNKADPDATRVQFTLILNLPYMRFDTQRMRDATKDIIIHELGHLVALGPDQLRYFVDRASACDTYYVTDLRSCAKSESLYAILSEFWDDDFLTWSEQYKRLSGSAREAALRSYYRENRTEHVSLYAATHPDEDLAEVFMDFVIKPRPGGSTLAERKILALYELPELVALRTMIRTAN